MSGNMIATLCTCQNFGNIKLPCSKDLSIAFFVYLNSSYWGPGPGAKSTWPVLVEFAMLLVLTGEGWPVLQS